MGVAVWYYAIYRVTLLLLLLLYIGWHWGRYHWYQRELWTVGSIHIPQRVTAVICWEKENVVWVPETTFLTKIRTFMLIQNMKITMHNLTKKNVSSSQYIMRLCHLHGFTQVHIAHLTVILVQSQKNPVSASAMLAGKFLRIRKVFVTCSLLT